MQHRSTEQMEQVVARIQERWGQHAIHRASQPDMLGDLVLSTGWADVDRLLRSGGVARGHITELLGAGTAGQVALAARLLHQAQTLRLQVVYVDVCRQIDLETLAHWGVDLESLVVLRPQSWNDAIDMMRVLIRAGAAGVILLDRLYPDIANTCLQMLVGTLAEWNILLQQTLTTLLVISEIESPESYPYGRALPHFCYTRLGFLWQGWLYQRRRCIGCITQITVLKNRAGPSGGVCRIEMLLQDNIQQGETS